MNKLSIKNIGPYKSDWAIAYADPNDTYSAGGGRLTVVMSDYVGSAFFSHVSQPSFKKFIAQCDAGYLLNKLFPKTVRWIAVEDGEELIQAIWRERADEIKELRSSGEISKKELRELYEDLKSCEFSSISHLYDLLDQKQLETISSILSDDWWWDGVPSKVNHVYEYLKSMLEGVISEFKKISEEPQP
ncbi:hypothetical protein SB581_12210 [Acinetobacter baumannii]|nr:hypothetical protein SB581_12210 [Acinetobacter baumannii]